MGGQYEKLSKNEKHLKALQNQIKNILTKFKGKELCSHEIAGAIHTTGALKAIEYVIETDDPRWNIASVVGSVAQQMPEVKKGENKKSPLTGTIEETWYIEKT